MYEKDKIRDIVEDVILEYVPAESIECAKERLEVLLKENKMIDIEGFIGFKMLLYKRGQIKRRDALNSIMEELRKG